MRTKMAAVLLALCVGFGAPALISSASADSITFDAAIPSQLTDWRDIPLSFLQFDPSLGKLTEVDLSLTATADTSFTFLTSGNSGTASFRAYYVTLSLSVADSGGFISNGSLISDVSLLPAANGHNINGSYFAWSSPITTGVPVTAGPYSTTATGSASYTDAGLLALLTGTGTTSLFVSTETGTFISFSVNSPGTMSEATYAGLNASITYDYTPVPLPAASLLFAPGLLGLAAVRKRFKACPRRL